MLWRLFFIGVVSALIGGCAQLGYYAQAAQGQLTVMSEARPIDDWLMDTEASDQLKSRLNKLKEIRAFAVAELGLPDNGSYKTYADIKRPYVLWNVVATPELSMKLKQWCFPIAGCVSYRGYYSRNDAQDYAQKLRNQHYDVQVGGVPAYSTLGWFNDPALSTFIHYSEGELARLIFHELAHQVVYAPGDSHFNESFATAVEELGVERWIAKNGDEKMRRSYRENAERKKEFLALLMTYKKKLEANYERVANDAEKRSVKVEIFQMLQRDYQTMKAGWNGYAGYDRWFAEPLSNAHLAAVATYHDYVPAFRALLGQEKNLPQFYEAVRALARLDKSERQQRLAALVPLPMASTRLETSGQ